MNLASIVWDVDPVLVRIGSIELRWYGLMWGLGFILAYEIMARLFKKEGHPDTWVDKLFVYCIVSSVIGARLGHCLFYEWDYYGAHPIEILKIWKGGLASHGGVFLLILALVWYSKKVTKKSVWWLFDRMIPAVAVVCMCIRFGNLMNSEIFGYPTTLPWGFEFVRSREWQELYNQRSGSGLSSYADLRNALLLRGTHRFVGNVSQVSIAEIRRVDNGCISVDILRLTLRTGVYEESASG